MKAPPPINEDFLRPPVEYDQPKPQKGSLFLWTVFILLLVGFTMVCWIGSYLVFSRPEIPLSYKVLRKIKKIDLPQRFKVQDPPKGEFLGPEKLYEKFSSLSPSALRKLNAELERNYLRNYQALAITDSIPYAKGRFTILDSYELGPNDFVESGVVTLAVAADYPKLLIEHLYCAPANVAPIIKRNLRTGTDIELRRTYELTAVLHAAKLGDGRIQLTVVPLNYGSYVFQGNEGGFSLEPPTELNVAAGWPVIRKDRYKEANDAYVAFRTKTGFGPMAAYRDADKKPDTVLKGVDPAPEATPAASPSSTPAVVQATPPPAAKGPTPAGGKKGATPTPTLVVKNDAPTPRPVAPTPTPSDAVKAVPSTAVSLQPFLQAPSATSPVPNAVAGAVPPTAAESTKNWRTYDAGQQPAGRQVRMGELTGFNEHGGLNGDTVYLSGQFTVRAVGENKTRGIKNAVLRSAAEGNVRVIVEYPADRPLPAQGAELNRDEQKPFQVTHIQATPDGTLNVYAREIMN